jgi:uncharacterized protein (TIGR00251 family)
VSERASVTLAVRVTPRAATDAVVGWRDDTRDELLVRVTAAPEGGKANTAVIKTLARSLGIPKSTVKVVRGTASRQKLLAFEMEEQAYQHWRDAVPLHK